MNFALRMPDSLGEALKEISQKDRISINQFINTAVAEKLATLNTIDLIGEMSDKGSRAQGLEILKKVSKEREPLENDRLD